MKRWLFLLAGFFLLSSLAGAAPSPCLSESLAKYIELGSGGCSIGGATFANFGYSAKTTGGAAQIPPDQIQVTPLFVVPAGFGLTFTAAWKAASGQTLDAYIKYMVQPGVPNLNQTGTLSLKMGAFHLGTIGTVTVQGETTFGDLRTVAECANLCTAPKADFLEFWPTAPVAVLNHVSLVPKTGGASLASFTATIDLCPLCV